MEHARPVIATPLPSPRRPAPRASWLPCAVLLLGACAGSNAEVRAQPVVPPPAPPVVEAPAVALPVAPTPTLDAPERTVSRSHRPRPARALPRPMLLAPASGQETVAGPEAEQTLVPVLPALAPLPPPVRRTRAVEEEPEPELDAVPLPMPEPPVR